MLPSSLSFDLANAADSVIAKVLSQGGVRSGKPSGEVSAVRAMTLDGFDEIAAAWSPLLKAAGYRIDLVAVFCHSRPQVTFAPVPHPNYLKGKTPRRCELADLLIVIDHEDPLTKAYDRRAVLVQAKILKGSKLNLSGSEWVQHELLAWLQSFSFVDAGYDLRSRNLNGSPRVGSPVCTAEYGGIDLKRSPPEWRHELTEQSAPWFHSPVELSSFLASMATGHSSCGREAVKGGLDDWSFTVDELLSVTAAQSITKQSGTARGNSNVVGFVTSASLLQNVGSSNVNVSIVDTSSFGGGGNNHFEGDLSEWPEGPISTVHLTLISIDDRSEK